MKAGWSKEKGYVSVWSKTAEFNECTYKVWMWVQENHKVTRFWVSASSGRKRKGLSVFEEKSDKSLGGLKALIWIKTEMLLFPEHYKSVNKKQYICVQWADSRRRNIYERLLKEGFRYAQIDGEKTLIKKL